MSKRSVIAVVLAVAALCPVWSPADPARAGCAGPSIGVEPAEGPPGGTVTIRGRYFSRDCSDAHGILGGTPCNPPPLASRPLRGIDLVLVGPDRERVLATVDGFDFEHEVAIPPDTPGGEATIEARFGTFTRARPVPFTITGEPVQPQPPAVSEAWLPAPGYLLAGSDRGVFAYGAATFLEATDDNPGCGPSLTGAVVAIAARAPGGYWTTTRKGYVFRYEAGFHGAAFPFDGGDVDHGPVLALAAHPGGYGYWQATATGGVFAFGEAPFLGSLGDADLNGPIVGITS